MSNTALYLTAQWRILGCQSPELSVYQNVTSNLLRKTQRVATKYHVFFTV